MRLPATHAAPYWVGMRRFTEDEYRKDPAGEVARVAEHERAAVVRPDGSVRVVISIPSPDHDPGDEDRS